MRVRYVRLRAKRYDPVGWKQDDVVWDAPIEFNFLSGWLERYESHIAGRTFMMSDTLVFMMFAVCGRYPKKIKNCNRRNTGSRKGARGAACWPTFCTMHAWAEITLLAWRGDAAAETEATRVS